MLLSNTIRSGLVTGAAVAFGAFAAPSVNIPLANVSIINGSSADRDSAPATVDAALRYRSVTSGTVVGTPQFSLLGLLFPTAVPLSQAIQTLTGSPADLDTVLGNPSGGFPVGGVPQVLSGSATVLTQEVTVTATLTVGVGSNGVARFSVSDVAIAPAAVGGLRFVTGSVTLTAIGCIFGLNFDGVVDDADFQLFVPDYDTLVLAAAQTGGDFNGDGLCDDADFQLFVVAYDTLLCP
jgi:hypothetical protein